MKRLSILLLAVTTLCLAAVAAYSPFITGAAPNGPNWSQWRGPEGSVKQQTTRKYTLSTDCGSLIVDYDTDRPGFSFEAKRVFLRK